MTDAIVFVDAFTGGLIVSGDDGAEPRSGETGLKSFRAQLDLQRWPWM